MTLKKAVQEVASKGRYGDTMLVHMNPAEVQYMHDNTPTGLTINPDTGQPEAFLPMLLALVGGGMGTAGMLGGMGAAAGAGLGSFAGSMAQGDEFDKALISGITSYGLGMLGEAGTAVAEGSTVAAEKAAEEAAKAAALNTTPYTSTMLPQPPPLSWGGTGAGTMPPFVGATPDQTIGQAAQKEGFLGNVFDEYTASGNYGAPALMLGASYGGLGQLAGIEPDVYEPPPKRKYPDRPVRETKPRAFSTPPPPGYRPGYDPEYPYFTGYADGGYIKPPPGYVPGVSPTHDYGFGTGITTMPTSGPGGPYTSTEVLAATAAADANAIPQFSPGVGNQRFDPGATSRERLTATPDQMQTAFTALDALGHAPSMQDYNAAGNDIGVGTGQMQWAHSGNILKTPEGVKALAGLDALGGTPTLDQFNTAGNPLNITSNVMRNLWQERQPAPTPEATTTPAPRPYTAEAVLAQQQADEEAANPVVETPPPGYVPGVSPTHDYGFGTGITTMPTSGPAGAYTAEGVLANARDDIIARGGHGLSADIPEPDKLGHYRTTYGLQSTAEDPTAGVGTPLTKGQVTGNQQIFNNLLQNPAGQYYQPGPDGGELANYGSHTLPQIAGSLGLSIPGMDPPELPTAQTPDIPDWAVNNPYYAAGGPVVPTARPPRPYTAAQVIAAQQAAAPPVTPLEMVLSDEEPPDAGKDDKAPDHTPLGFMEFTELGPIGTAIAAAVPGGSLLSLANALGNVSVGNASLAAWGSPDKIDVPSAIADQFFGLAGLGQSPKSQHMEKAINYGNLLSQAQQLNPDVAAAEAAASAAANEASGLGIGVYAEGGGIDADQAQLAQDNPIAMNAVQAILGNHPEPQQAIATFIKVYGEEAFVELRQAVIAEASEEQREQSGIGGMINGPGTGKSDSIPGQITQNGQDVEEIRVSDGEYILPKATVDAVGEPALNELRRATNGGAVG